MNIIAAFAGLLAGVALIPAAAHAQQAPAATTRTQPAFVQDMSFEESRRAILGMAGTFRVTFDMREQNSWRAGYTPIPPAVSGGNEVVRVIADTGRFISLQHMLVVSHEGSAMVIKHWRQDWTYEPESVLVYAGQGQWRTESVPAARRTGAWSQTVWQVDDSPRYGAVGRWTNTGGVPRWRSDWTWRPLARRDATRNPRPPFDRYLSINRHSPTPGGGWIHWQDNQKMGLVDGQLVPFVQENLLNTYAPSTGFDAAPADRYWAATSAYWAVVREEWARAERMRSGIRLTEDAQMGNTISGRLFEMGTQIFEGRLQSAAAIIEARRLIREGTGTVGN